MEDEEHALEELMQKTADYIKDLGITSTGVYFYEKACQFKINWQKGVVRGLTNGSFWGFIHSGWAV